MENLSNKDKKYLRKLGMDLKPVVMIGKNGLTKEILLAIAEALLNHELIKLKFIDHKEEKKEIINEILEKSEAQLVHKIGNTAVIYRENSNPENKKIFLPKK